MSLPTSLSALKGESLKVILIVLLGWSCFSFADTTSKFLTQHYSAALIISINAIITISIIAAWILYDKGWRGFLSPRWKWLVARAVCIGLVSTCVVNAFRLIPLADVYGITFSAPFIAVCLAFILLKENVGLHRWLSVIIGFVGVIILVGPQFNVLNIGLVFAIVAALSIAAGTIVIRKIGHDEYMPLFVLYPFIGMLTINLPIAVNELHIPDTPFLWYFLANTLFVVGGVSATTYAIAHAKATASVAPFVYVQIIWGVVFGYFIFDDIPTLPTIIGLTLIIGAGIYMILRERQLNKNP
jgi:S-adenosylmethionine uptake transporter